MKISIMITTYNCENYIDDAVNSVIAQRKPFEWELLIGDDGSTDGSLEKINTWIAKYPNNIKLFSMERHANDKKDGTRAAKNRSNLLRHAQGEYLIFLDGDDQFLGTDKLVKQVNILDSKEYSNCSCVAHNIEANDLISGSRYPLTHHSVVEGVIDSQKYWKELYFHTNTILFRSQCKELMLKEPHCNYLNDNFITFVLLQFGPIYYIPEIWARYNLTGDGLWTGKKRVYGCFRNIILYDLEVSINRKFHISSLVRHLYDFRYIFSNYKMDDKPSVYELIKDLDPLLFDKTILMYNSQGTMRTKDKMRLVVLKAEIEIVNFSRYPHRVIQKVRRQGDSF